eukprot:GHVL01018508.1.p1 GENE.GHVL01018508.1~~GHVL01018508.1.p1  ORF type:complete len:111 (+),score=2.88 GHVL01018508.1:521-853(+)
MSQPSLIDKRSKSILSPHTQFQFHCISYCFSFLFFEPRVVSRKDQRLSQQVYGTSMERDSCAGDEFWAYFPRPQVSDTFGCWTGLPNLTPCLHTQILEYSGTPCLRPLTR